MTSKFMMWCLIAGYLVVTLTCIGEKRYYLALYWFSAASLNLAVILMNK